MYKKFCSLLITNQHQYIYWLVVKHLFDKSTYIFNLKIMFLDHEVKPEEIGMITWANKNHLSESKKPFMVVYLKSRHDGVIISSPSLQKHYRRRRKTIETSSNTNPLQGKINLS